MKRIALCAGLALCLLAAPSSADELEFFTLPSYSETQAMYAPSVACGPDGVSLVLYNAQDVLLQTFVEAQFVMTQGTSLPVMMPAPLALGSGYLPQAAWTREGWVCAYSTAGVLSVHGTDTYGNWDQELATTLLLGGMITKIDMCGIDQAGFGPDCMIVAQLWLDPPTGGFAVAYVERGFEGWSEPVTIVPEQDVVTRPQVTWSPGIDGPYPTVFYHTYDGAVPHLWQITRDASGWSAPIEVFADGVSMPTDIWGDFDVVRPTDQTFDLLGLGPTPTCPCQDMLFQRFDEGWSALVDVTGSHDYYDQAYSPSLAVDPSGHTYAFWMQEGSDPMLEPHSRTLEFRVRNDDGWTDRGGELAAQDPPAPGHRVAIDVDRYQRPVLAWVQVDTVDSVEQPPRIRIGRRNAWSPVVEAPAARLDLRAWPNPFNPIVRLALTVAESGPVTLSIHDARGRRLCTLLQGEPIAEHRELTWNGADETGRPLPSGVYFARAITPSGATTTKLVLAR